MPSSLADETAYLSIGELADAIRSRKLSPVELVEASITRIETRNHSLNAFMYTNWDYARRRAREIESRVLAGDEIGPLQGLPTAIKDLSDSRPGWIGTLGGIPALKDHVIDSYCTFAERMERAGAIPLGKTNSPTLGFRGTCDNFLFGPTRNPFDLAKNSGGSSGGSAAAVADGLVPFAEGTDGGGSIRIPAAWCGVYGFKGTSGRVARLQRPQAFSLTGLFTFEGCITRSVEDTAYVLESLCGPDERDPFSLSDRVPWLESTTRSVKGWKVAFSPDLGVFPVDPRVQAIVADAAKAFEEAGAFVEEVKVDLSRSASELGDLWCRLMAPSNLMQIHRLALQGVDLLGSHRDDLPPELVFWMENARRQSLIDMASDQEMRTEVYDAVQGVFETHDLLLTPTLACPPVDNASDGNTLGPESINGERINRLIGWCPTFFFNFTGHPAASAPAGLFEGRWPVGIQIVGKRFADAEVITASANFEMVRPWKQHYRICQERSLT